MENGDSGALDPERSLQPPDTDSEPPDTDSDGVRPPAPAGTSPALGDGIRRRVSDLSNGSGGPGEENLRGIAARRAALVTDDDGKAAERDTGMDVELPGTPSKARTPSEVDSQRDGEGKDPRQLPVNIGWGPDASPPGGVEEPAKWASSPRANGSPQRPPTEHFLRVGNDHPKLHLLSPSANGHRGTHSAPSAKAAFGRTPSSPTANGHLRSPIANGHGRGTPSAPLSPYAVSPGSRRVPPRWEVKVTCDGDSRTTSGRGEGEEGGEVTVDSGGATSGGGPGDAQDSGVAVSDPWRMVAHLSLWRTLRKGGGTPLRVLTKRNLRSILRKGGGTETDSAGKALGKHAQRLRFYIPPPTKTFEFSVWTGKSSVVKMWKTWFILPLAFEIWAFPFRTALLEPSRDTWMYACDVAVDVLFLLDAACKCNTSFAVDGVTVTSRVLLARRYLLFVFPFELFPSILFHVFSARGTSYGLWFAFQIPRLLPRAARLEFFFRSMKLDLNVRVPWLQLLEFSLVIGLSAHWIGCFYYTISRAQGFTEETWVYRLEQIIPRFTMKDSSIPYLYLLCLSKGFEGLANISYLTRLPDSRIEMVMAMLVMFLSIYLSAYILGSLFQYLLASQQDALSEGFKKTIKSVETFADERNLPFAVRAKLLQHFEFQYRKAMQASDWGSLKLPRSLETKVANSRFRPAVEKCCLPGGLLSRCNRQFVDIFVGQLRQVYMMPGEHFLRSGEMALELFFVLAGAAEVIEVVSGVPVVKKSIRGDLPDTPSVVGEISFFLGVPLQNDVRAGLDQAMEVLVLSREAAENLFVTYPEQQETIVAMVLHGLRLKPDGTIMVNKGAAAAAAGGDTGEDVDATPEEDTERVALRTMVMGIVKRRREEDFQSLSYAATSGDLEEVRRLIRRGIGINSSNYDQRTVLHLAAAEGNVRLVELLLGEGAEKNKQDRWGNTPLQDAVYSNQGAVVQLLEAAHALVFSSDPAGSLCDAASSGDLAAVKKLLEYGIDPNVGDYDRRTPLHVAVAEGHLLVVQFLLSKGADFQAKDRWGNSPLQDAVSGRQTQVASVLRAMGGVLEERSALEQMLHVAAEGDVSKLRMLVQSGIPIDQGDYDERTALHLATTEARLLAVSFLLSSSANPNVQHRRGWTPLDHAVDGGTIRHLMCGKIMLGFGGEFGMLQGEKAREGRAKLDAIPFEDVRETIKTLMAQGLDEKKPERATLDEVLISTEASHRLMIKVAEMRATFEHVAKQVETEAAYQNTLRRKLSLYALVVSAANDLVTEYQDAKGRVELMSDTGRTARRLQAVKTIKTVEDATTEVGAITSEMVSDAEVELYEELDAILAANAREHMATVPVLTWMAKEFQKIVMNLSRAEDLWHTLDSEFRAAMATPCAAKEEPRVTLEEFGRVLLALGLTVSPRDVTSMFSSVAEDEVGAEGHRVLVNPMTLLCTSPAFRRHVRGPSVQGGSHRQALLQYAQTLRIFSFSQLKYLVNTCESLIVQDDEELTYTFNPENPGLFLVMSGSLELTVEYLDEDSQMVRQVVVLEANQSYGELAVLCGAAPAIKMEKRGKVEAIVVHKKEIALFLTFNPQVVPDMSKILLSQLEKSLLRPWEAAALRKMREIKSDNFSQSRLPGGLQDVLGMVPGVDQALHVQQVKNVVDVIFEYHNTDAAGSSTVLSACLYMWKVETFPEGAGAFEKKSSLDQKEREKLTTLREGIDEVETTWDLFAPDAAKVVPYGDLMALVPFMGEVGETIFKSLFDEKCPAELTIEDWWSAWMRFIANTHSKEPDQDPDDGSDTESPAEAPLAEDSGLEGLEGAPAPYRELTATQRFKEHLLGFTGAFMSKVQPARDVTTELLRPHNRRAYAPTYVSVVGDIHKLLQRDQVKTFLKILMVDFKYQIQERNVDEFMRLFAPEGRHAQWIAFADIHRKLQESGSETQIPDYSVFVGKSFRSMLNPNSTPVKLWHTSIEMVGLVQYFHAPIRCVFQPYDHLIEDGIIIDLFCDCLLLINVALCFCITYHNKNNILVRSHAKASRKYLAGDIWWDLSSAVPWDWIAYLAGASLTLMPWCRLSKLLVLVGHYRSVTKTGLLRHSVMRKPGFKMIAGVIMVLHASTCIWYLLGQKSWEITWYQHGDDPYTDFPTAFDYELLGRAHSDRSSTADRYLLAAYWVCALLTTNGTVGDLYPKNVGEVLFMLLLVCLSLTLFNYVVGEISAMVMQTDEKMLKLREEAGAVEKFLKSQALPAHLKLEIQRFFEGDSRARNVSSTEIFDSVSHSLRVEMSAGVTRECLETAELFRNTSPGLKAAVRGLLYEVLFEPEELLYSANDPAKEMYFIISGSVDKMDNVSDSEKDVVQTMYLGPGAAVGHLSCFFGIRHMDSARASNRHGASCLRLVRSQLMQVLKLYHEDEEIVAQNALKFFQKAMHDRSSVSGVSHDQKSQGGGRGGASTVRSFSVAGSRVEEGSEDSGTGTELTMETGGGGNADVHDNTEAAVLSQKVEDLTSRRKAEQINAILGAASRGELDKVRRYLSTEVVSVNDTDMNGRTALHLAAAEGQLETVEYLLEAGASTQVKDKHQNNALNEAVRHGHDEVAKAITTKEPQTLRLPNKAAGVLMCSHGTSGSVHDLSRLLEVGVDMNTGDYDDRTALHLSASEGQISAVQFLLDKGADVNVLDRMGGTPLDDAIRHGHASVQRILLAAGGQVLATDTAQAMCVAASNGDVSTLRTLLENKANPAGGDRERRTPLHLAAGRGKTTALDLLISHLAHPEDIDAVDVYGATPLDDAYAFEQSVAVAMLESHGARRTDNPEFVAELEKRKTDQGNTFRIGRLPKVLVQVGAAPEAAALVWVRGRCGKLLPQELTEARDAAHRFEASLHDLVQGILHALPPSLAARVDTREIRRVYEDEATAPARMISSRRNSTLTFLDQTGVSPVLDMGRMEDSELFAKFMRWSVAVRERMAEELPTGLVLRLAARPYSSRAEVLSLSLAKTLAVAKLLQTEVDNFTGALEKLRRTRAARENVPSDLANRLDPQIVSTSRAGTPRAGPSSPTRLQGRGSFFFGP